MNGERWWNTSHGAMAIVFAMYLCKVIAKLTIGYHIHSPMITGDGWHNLADLLEVIMVVVAVGMSRRPADEHYPFGRKNVESIARAAIGVGLLLAALRFVAASVAGLLSYAPELDRAVRDVFPFLPQHHALSMGSGVAPWVIGSTVLSVALSFAVSRYEIRVGKRHGHPSMVADGEETRSDGMVESAILVGILSEYLFRAPWLEYVFGLGVAVLITRTGVELFLGGWHALLQRSLGREVETALKEVCLRTHGVVGVERIVTSAVGNQAVGIIKILTDAPGAAHDDLNVALKRRLKARIEGFGHEHATFYLRFARTPANERRVAYAIIKEGATCVVARDLDEATHVLVCDTQRGVAYLSKFEDLAAIRQQGDVFVWLGEKRVDTLYFFGVRPPFVLLGITYACVSTYNVRALDVIDL